MRKTINIYTPAEKMPEGNTQLLIKNRSYGASVVHYLGGDDWSDVEGNWHKTEDINWWLDLYELADDMRIKLGGKSWGRQNKDD